MSLRRVVAAPFSRRGTDEVTRTEFIYSLTGDLGWFDPEGAEEALKAGTKDGLLVTDGDVLRADFDAENMEIPQGWSPDAVPEPSSSSSSRATGEERGVFERGVSRLVDSGYDKREAVAEINRLHAGMGDVRIEAAALTVLKREGLRTDDLAEEALEELRRD